MTIQAQQLSTNPSTLRVALVGAGKMGLHHLRAIRSVERARVVGVLDPRRGLSLPPGLVPDDAKVVELWSQLIDLQPDVVHIVTPPDTHADLSRRAIDAGFHVYVEKPFATSSDEAAGVLAMAAARGVKVCAGHQCLFERPALATWDMMPKLGRLVHVESFFSFRTVRRAVAPVDQAKDILPHAVYPLVEQLRVGSGLADDEISVSGVEVTSAGDVYALLRLGDCTGVLLVTLRGRPIEQYQHLVGTNGWLRTDYVTGRVTSVLGPGTGPGIVLTPFRRGFRTLTGATRGLIGLLRGGHTAYPGLPTLIDRFYGSILDGSPVPVSVRAIRDTVAVCERIGVSLDDVERNSEHAAAKALTAREATLPPTATSDRSTVLVTGGTGQLGRRVAIQLRSSGIGVRALARRLPRHAERIAGVDYRAVDLANGLPSDLLRDVRAIVHCAAETAGGQEDHQRNSIDATRHVVQAAAEAGVPAVIHVSSTSVLRPGRAWGDPLNEGSPIDVNDLGRGPYVWGKAESELLAQRLGRELDVAVKVIRPGPLVDYAAFHPPGRLGREVGPWFVAIGPRRMPLPVCDVGTAARVIHSYVESFDEAPPVVNLLEMPTPTRRELAERLRAARPDLRVLWMPAFILRLLAGPAKVAQRVLLHVSNPIDVYSAFASERYRTDVASSVIARAPADAAGRTAAGFPA